MQHFGVKIYKEINHFGIFSGSFWYYIGSFWHVLGRSRIGVLQLPYLKAFNLQLSLEGESYIVW